MEVLDGTPSTIQRLLTDMVEVWSSCNAFRIEASSLLGIDSLTETRQHAVAALLLLEEADLAIRRLLEGLAITPATTLEELSQLQPQKLEAYASNAGAELSAGRSVLLQDPPKFVLRIAFRLAAPSTILAASLLRNKAADHHLNAARALERNRKSGTSS